MVASVETQAFDPSVTSTVGDLWTQSVDPSAPLGVFTVGPGQSAVLDVTVTPTGVPGQVVTGDLYVDQLTELSTAAVNAENFLPSQSFLPSANHVAALAYRYTVG